MSDDNAVSISAGRVQIIDNKVCLSTSELLSILKVTKQALSQWKQNGCPQVMRGWWSIEEVFAWRGLTSSSGLKTDEEIESLCLAEQKLHYEVKYKQLQSEAIQLKNAISKGDYIPKEDIVTELQQLLVVLKKSIQSLSRKVSVEVSPYVDNQQVRVIERKISDILRDALEQLSIDGVYRARKRNK